MQDLVTEWKRQKEEEVAQDGAMISGSRPTDQDKEQVKRAGSGQKKVSPALGLSSGGALEISKRRRLCVRSGAGPGSELAIRSGESSACWEPDVCLRPAGGRCRVRGPATSSEDSNIEERKRSRTGGVGRRAEPHHRQSPGSVHGGAVAGRHVLLPCPEWS